MGQQKNILTNADRVILSVTCYGHFLCHFNMLVFPAILLPLSGLLQMSMADTLNLAFFMYLLMGLSAPLWGYMADKIGAIPLLALFYIGAGCSGLMAAFLLTLLLPSNWRWQVSACFQGFIILPALAG